jgi:hypothetical protein
MSETECRLIGGPHNGTEITVNDDCACLAFPSMPKPDPMFPVELVFPPGGGAPYVKPPKFETILYRRVSPTQFKYVEESK